VTPNETARILLALKVTEYTDTADILVNARLTLRPTTTQILSFRSMLEVTERAGLVHLVRVDGEINAARLTELGAKRAREPQEQMR
jgi:hypothetical protein